MRRKQWNRRTEGAVVVAEELEVLLELARHITLVA